MNTNRRVVAGKIESVEGTAETLAAEDGGILAISPKVDPDIKMNKRNPAMATFSKLADVPGGRLARLTFAAEVKGAGQAYSGSVQPALGKYLRACGHAETIDTTPGSEKATYKPASSGIPSITLGCYEDGVTKKIRGARGNCTFKYVNGEIIMIDFNFLGVWDGLVDGALLAPTNEATGGLAFMNSTFTVDGYAAVIKSLEFSPNNVLTPRDHPTDPASYKSVALTNRDPRGKFDPEMVLKATNDFLGLWQAGTPGALVVGDVGAIQYNKVKLTAPKLVYTKVGDGDRGGIAVADTAFQLAMNSGDDEYVLEFP